MTSTNSTDIKKISQVWNNNAPLTNYTTNTLHDVSLPQHFPLNSSHQLHVLQQDCYMLGVYSTQIHILH